MGSKAKRRRVTCGMSPNEVAAWIGVTGAMAGLGAAWGMLRQKTNATDGHSKSLTELAVAIASLTAKVDSLKEHNDTRIDRLESAVDGMHADLYSAMKVLPK